MMIWKSKVLKLSEASTVLGRPDVKQNPHHLSEMIACEAVGAGNCQLVLSVDNRLTETVIELCGHCFSKALKQTQY